MDFEIEHKGKVYSYTVDQIALENLDVEGVYGNKLTIRITGIVNAFKNIGDDYFIEVGNPRKFSNSLKKRIGKSWNCIYCNSTNLKYETKCMSCGANKNG